MRPMSHPDYRYTPHSEERRKRASEAARERLGIPAGHHRICGYDVPDDVLRLVKIEAAQGRRQGVEVARAHVEWMLSDQLIGNPEIRSQIAQAIVDGEI